MSNLIKVPSSLQSPGHLVTRSLGLAFFAFLLHLTSYAQSPSLYSRVKIVMDESASPLELLEIGLDIDHGDYAPGKHFITDLTENDIARLTEAGWPFEILIPDVAEWYAARAWEPLTQNRDLECDNSDWSSTTTPTPAHFNLGSMGGFYTYQEMITILDQMAALFPHLLTIRDTISGFHTHDGNPIYWVKLSDNPQIDEEEPEALFTALHHAREPVSLSQLIFFMWHLLEGYGTDPEITYLVNETEIFFIPCINPDGYLYNEFTNPQGGGLWRKNRRYNEEDGSFGVDLNRNYGFGWGYDNFGSSPAPASQIYRGPEPFSEPETQAVASFANAHQFQIALNYHSFGNLLIYPWGYTDTETVDALTFRSFSDAMTRENFFRAGTGSETVGYPVNGTADDWMYGELAAFSMTPEVGPGIWGFWPQAAEIENLCQSTLLQNTTALNLLLVYGLATDQSSWLLTESQGAIPFSLKRFGLKEGPLTVSLSGLNPSVLSTSASQTFTTGAFQTETGEFTYTLDPATPPGSEIAFLLSVSNGNTSWADTLKKVFHPAPVYLWTDASENPSQWALNEGWGSTATHFKSPPQSWTDSPAGNYSPNAFTQLLSHPLTIDSAESAVLSFWTRWDLEPGFDFVQFQAVDEQENLLAPLCGRYTSSGAGPFQPEDEPVYDGFQDPWVEEVLDLSAFIGQTIRIRIVLASDAGVQKDGFFFDDMKLIRFGTPNPSSLKEPARPGFSIHPNPASQEFLVSLDRPGRATMILTDLHGRMCLEREISSKEEEIQVSGLPEGLYLCRLVGDKQWLGAQKVLISR